MTMNLQTIKNIMLARFADLENTYTLEQELDQEQLDDVTGEIDNVVDTVNPNGPPRPNN